MTDAPSLDRARRASRVRAFHPRATAVALIVAASCARAATEPRPDVATGTGAPAHAPAGAGLTRADRARWRAVVHWPDRCERGFDYPDPSLGGVDVFPLGAGQSLLQVCCTLGAYQGTYRYYRIDERTSPLAVTELVFTTYVSSGSPGPGQLEVDRTAALTGEPRFDAATKQLVVLNRYRGPGDCGMLSTYALEGAQPVLVAVRAQLDCDGPQGTTDPARWPSLQVKQGALVR